MAKTVAVSVECKLDIDIDGKGKEKLEGTWHFWREEEEIDGKILD